MTKSIVSVLIAAFAIHSSFAADIYVDANAAAGGDGSQAAPYQTIKAGVDAANLITSGEDITVNVRGGDDRVYNIVTGSDLMTVSVPNVKIMAWGDYGKPHIELSDQLSVNAATDAPLVIHYASGANYGEVNGLVFYLYGYNAKQRSGNSLGKSGRVLAFTANNCTADGCEFHQTGAGNDKWGGDGCVTSQAEQGTRATVGRYLTVRNCLFDSIRRGGGVRAVRTGDYCDVYCNVYTNCQSYFMPVKQTTGGGFWSNRVVNCTNPLTSNGENWQELANYEISYNIFVNSGITFFQKSVHGMSTVKIHHNTVIGCDKFIELLINTTVTSKIFDNLVLSSTGTLLYDSTTVSDTQFSGFKSGSTLKGNAYLIGTFSGGSATEDERYSLATLDQADNQVLSLSPDFEDTSDITSEEYYRLNATRYPWVEKGTGGPEGAYPTYIGAVKPSSGAQPGEFFQIDTFTSEGETHAPAEITFTVQYSQNAGPVTIWWDFDGDGEYEVSSSETTKSHTYLLGVYTPQVKAVDSETGKEVTAVLAFPLDITLTDVYVDANASAGGNGTSASPFKTIREGVQYCDVNGTVHVKGGSDRLYSITGECDRVIFVRSGTTIAAWNDGERAKVELARGLYQYLYNQEVFSIPLGIDNVKISGLDVLLHAGGNTATEYSLYSDAGSVFRFYGDNGTVEDCVFTIDGVCNTGRGGYIVRSHAEEGAQQPGKNITVKNCSFANLCEYFFRSGLNASVIGNSLTNCTRMVWPLKSGWCDFTFVSNRMVKCGTFATTVPNWNELPQGVFAYNIFVTDDGTPFITKGKHGLTSDQVYIHHNTVIGGPLISVPDSSVSWPPRIFDNVVSAPDGKVVVETGTAFAAGNYSSFKTDGVGFFRNNAYFADALNGGTATEVAGYDLSRGLPQTDNIVLMSAPKFVSTDINSPDFYRPSGSANSIWSGKGFAWTDEGKYPAYIGAVKPLPAGLTLLFR